MSTRRRILDLHRERRRLLEELTAELGLSQPGTSKHLRVLREAGLARVRAQATRARRAAEARPHRDGRGGRPSMISACGAIRPSVAALHRTR